MTHHSTHACLVLPNTCLVLPMHACLITIGQIHDLGTPRLASEANLIVAFESTPAGTATARIVLYCFPTYFSSFCTSPHAPCSMHAPLKIILQERVIVYC